MRSKLLSLAASLSEQDEPFAVATVVRRQAPTSVQLGDAAIVTRSGKLHGWIGGSCTESTLIEQALEVIETGRPRLLALGLDAGAEPGEVTAFPMTCHSGGGVQIYIDPVLPAPTLLLLGTTPISRALARIAKAIDYKVHLAGPGSEAAAFPEVDVAFDELHDLEDRYADRPPGVKLFALVSTMGQADEQAIMAASRCRPDYIGVVASERRVQEIRQSPVLRQLPEEVLQTIRGPAGIDIGAKTPEQIAVSILAEMVSNVSLEKPKQFVTDLQKELEEA